MLDKLIAFGIKFGVALLEISAGFFLGPKIKHIIERFSAKASDKGILTFMGSLANISIKILAVIIALSQLGADITVLVGLFSALGLGISLSLQNNMANLAGGLQILLTRPFTVGDLISCEDKEGVVTRVELMYTTLQTFDRQEVVIPNSDLVNNPLTNYSQEPIRRIVINVQTAGNYNPAAFKEEIQKIMDGISLIQKDPASSVLTTSIEGTACQITAYAYVPAASYRPVFCELNQKIQEKRLEMNVPLAFSPVEVLPAKQK